MTTNWNLDIIYCKIETIAIIPILNIYWQEIFIVRLLHDLRGTPKGFTNMTSSIT